MSVVSPYSADLTLSAQQVSVPAPKLVLPSLKTVLHTIGLECTAMHIHQQALLNNIRSKESQLQESYRKIASLSSLLQQTQTELAAIKSQYHQLLQNVDHVQASHENLEYYLSETSAGNAEMAEILFIKEVQLQEIWKEAEELAAARNYFQNAYDNSRHLYSQLQYDYLLLQRKETQLKTELAFHTQSQINMQNYVSRQELEDEKARVVRRNYTIAQLQERVLLLESENQQLRSCFQYEEN